MKEQTTNKTRTIGVRFSPKEFEELQKKWKASTCRKLSDYVRRRLFDQQITATYRNKSMDDFMAELIQLRNDLNALGNNFNQAVRKLHSLDQLSEFRAWLTAWDASKIMLQTKVDEIKKQIGKFADLWLQK